MCFFYNFFAIGAALTNGPCCRASTLNVDVMLKSKRKRLVARTLVCLSTRARDRANTCAINTHAHTHILAHSHTHTRTHAHMHARTQAVTDTHTHSHAYIHKHKRRHTDTDTDTDTYTQTQTHTDTDTDTQTHTDARRHRHPSLRIDHDVFPRNDDTVPHHRELVNCMSRRSLFVRSETVVRISKAQMSALRARGLHRAKKLAGSSCLF